MPRNIRKPAKLGKDPGRVLRGDCLHEPPSVLIAQVAEDPSLVRRFQLGEDAEGPVEITSFHPSWNFSNNDCTVSVGTGCCGVVGSSMLVHL